MSAIDTVHIRNVGFIGHGSCGKTTVTSALLYTGGAVKRLGHVDDGSAVTDSDPEEIERKMSIAVALAHFPWDGRKINILDLPGAAGFVHEAKAALKVVDTAISVICGVAGVEVQTEKTWRFATDHGLAQAVVINKLDRERSDFDRVLANLQDKFGRKVVAFHLPVGAEDEFSGVIDLVTMKAYTYSDDSGKGEEGDIPPALNEKAQSARETLMEAIAEVDDHLMECFFENGELTPDEMTEGLRRGIRERKIVPVLAASALKSIGSDRLAGFVASLLPDPAGLGEARGTVPGGQEESTRPVDSQEPLSLFVFKTLADPFSGRISLMRVMSGTARLDGPVHNFSRDSNEKLSNMSLMQGKDLSKVQELRAGDLGCLTKLKDTITGNTLGDAAAPIIYAPVEPPEAAISFAIEPRSRGDEDKLSNAMARIIEEDPALCHSRDPRTHEILLSGTGITHVEVALAKMKKKFGVDCLLRPPKVPYLETIKKRAEATARHKKQTGGHGQFAECRIAVEPLESGAGYEFVDKIFGGSISQGYRPAVNKGVQEASARGVIAGYPLSDFRVTLLDGKEHPVDSSEMAFKIAASMAFRECMKTAQPILMEPIMEVEVAISEEFMGDIMGDMNSRRGRVQGMDNSGENQVIKAQVPMAEMLTYSQTLKSITGGRGSFHMTLNHYEQVPAHIQKKLLAELAKEKEGAS
ncbi:MAG: elongation factor G [Acidobacteria bacterium]|nr:MAG: elongation factor G [Acidobacteriota bacterium]